MEGEAAPDLDPNTLGDITIFPDGETVAEEVALICAMVAVGSVPKSSLCSTGRDERGMVMLENRTF